MIFLLVAFSFCHQVYDFTSGSYPGVLTIYFEPLDTVEVRIRRYLGVFFSTRFDSNELILDIEAGNQGDQIQKYGPFGPESGLAGVYFKTKNYSLKFNNKGPEQAKIALLFDNEKIPESYPYSSNYDYTFPIFHTSVSEAPSRKLRSLTNPLIYHFEQKKSDSPFMLLCIILGTLCLMGVFYVRK